MSKLTQGEVTFDLDGVATTLSPTIGAATKISAYFQGFQTAQQRLLALDFQAHQVVLGFALGLKSEGEKSALKDRLYRTGLNTTVGPLVEFVAILANGGRPLDATDDDESDAVGNAA